MKKIILLIVLLSIIGIFIASFVLIKGSDAKEVADVVETNSSETIELKFGHHMPKESALGRAALHFASKVERKTDGKVKIRVFANQELGDSHKMLELSRLGEIDILATATAKLSVTVPSMQYADLPFLFPTREDAHALLDGKTGNSLLKNLDSIDLLGMTFWEGGFKNFTANRPLLKIEDFKDLKIRVMKSRIIMEQFHALGARPIIIDFHKTKQALEDGVIDSLENPLSATFGMRFYEAQSDITLSGHGYVAYVLTLSKKSTLKLPPETLATILKTAKEIAPWQRKESLKDDKKILEMIKKSGINIHTISLDEKKRFVDATAYIIKEYEDIIGSKIIAYTKEYFIKKANNHSLRVEN